MALAPKLKRQRPLLRIQSCLLSGSAEVGNGSTAPLNEHADCGPNQSARAGQDKVGFDEGLLPIKGVLRAQRAGQIGQKLPQQSLLALPLNAPMHGIAVEVAVREHV
jgi:hypothetical protein